VVVGNLPPGREVANYNCQGCSETLQVCLGGKWRKYRGKRTHLPPLWLSFTYNELKPPSVGLMGGISNRSDGSMMLIELCRKKCNVGC